MIILLFGKDTFRSKRKLDEIVGEYSKKHMSGLNLRLLEGKSLDFEELRNEMFGLSMFEEKKLIIVSGAFSNKRFVEDFTAKGKEFLTHDNVIVFYEEDHILKKHDLYKFIQKKAIIKEYEPLKNAKLEQWAEKEVKERGGIIKKEALVELVDFIGNDLWRMSNEIHKLVFYDKEITKKSIDLLVRPQIETNIFNTIDDIANKNKKHALKLLREHLDKGDNIFYLLTMIASQFRNMLILKTASNPYETGLHPFVAKKASAQARKFSLEELMDIYSKLAKLDTDIKTGKIDAEIGLDLFIANI